MELDTTYYINGNNNSEKKQKRENNLYFEYGKAGHRVIDC